MGIRWGGTHLTSWGKGEKEEEEAGWGGEEKTK